jgi:AraC-like DNA-binding protein
MKLYIKYMVSNTCKMVVRECLKKLGISYDSIELGRVEFDGAISSRKREEFKRELSKVGLELLDDNKNILVERIKIAIIEMVHVNDEMIKMNFSAYLSKKLNHDYTYLSNIFTEMQGINIQQFILLHKAERIKELMTYKELTLSEIAYKMNYSSLAHLSSQFKKVTGFTPSHFKQMPNITRSPIEMIA